MIIGISANYAEGTYRIAQQYADCIIRSGACAIILPVTKDKNIIEQYMSSIDGLLLTGGGDMDPKFWGEKALPNSNLTPLVRDIYDLELYHAARRRCMPIMGICRGMQVMCIAEGGSLYQDIHTCFDDKAMNHSPKTDKREAAHTVKITHDFFHNLKTKTTIPSKDIWYVNSLHHQSINHLPAEFSLAAISDDDVIEAFVADHYPMFGVQWHPEHLAETMPEHAALFDHFVHTANVYKLAKQIHHQANVIDSHTDSPMVWNDNTNMSEWQEEMLVDFPKMLLTNMSATFMTAYLPQDKLGGEEQTNAYKKANKILAKLIEHANKDPKIRLAYTPKDVISNHIDGYSSVVLAIENAYALNGDIRNIALFHDMGVRYITLCHNGDNDICDSAAGGKTHNGLSSFGKQVIDEMLNKGIMIDISHASDETMEQTIKYCSKPVIASHSGARAICQHRRNIPDSILNMLANKNGVCQICLYDAFLNNNSSSASIKDIVTHIKHIISIIGIDHVGIGSDFDGGGGVKGCQSENEFINITMALINEGFSNSDIEKIMGGNILRVWSQYCDR